MAREAEIEEYRRADEERERVMEPRRRIGKEVKATIDRFGVACPHCAVHTKNVKYYDVEEFENLLRNPTDDPSIMKEMLVKCTTNASIRELGRAWETGALGNHWRKDTRVGFKQVKEQFETILKIFYFNEVFEYVPIEIGKEVHDLNAKYGYSKWNVEK